jgi:hypothetical protein
MIFLEKTQPPQVRTLRWNIDRNFLLMSVSEFLPTHDQPYLTDADTQTENQNSKFHSDTVQS